MMATGTRARRDFKRRAISSVSGCLLSVKVPSKSKTIS